MMLLPLLCGLACGATPTPLGRPTHVHLAVSDVARSTAFYQQKLGLELEWGNKDLAIFNLGPFKLMLGPGKLVKPAKLSGGEEGVAVAFQVDDAAAAYAELKRRGAPLTREPKAQSWGGTNFFVKDPDGYNIEYEQLTPPGQWRRDLELGKAGAEPLRADAFVPDGAGPFPALVVVHGGGFTGGDRVNHIKPLLDALITGDFTVVTIDYRLAPKFRHPAQVEDVDRAIDWVRAHAAELKADPARLGLVGESAGGYLVSFVGARAKGPERVKAVVAFYGAHDQETRAKKAGVLAASTQALYGLTAPDPAALKLLREASPIRYVSAQTPPFLLIHGTADEQVPYEQSTMMCEAMKTAGASCELYSVEGAIHGLNNWESEPRLQRYKAKLVEWLKGHL